jgi:hypothetical protein
MSVGNVRNKETLPFQVDRRYMNSERKKEVHLLGSQEVGK